MNKTPAQLPDDVRDALQRGNLFDAIKLLRRAGVSNLKEAKAVLEAEARRINAGKGPAGGGSRRPHPPAVPGGFRRRPPMHCGVATRAKPSASCASTAAWG